MSIGLIWGIVQIVAGVSVLIEGIFVAIDKIKLSKATIVLHCIIIAVLFISASIKYF